MDKPREFTVTRTIDNKQLGLTVLIESLRPGETKKFIEYSAYASELDAEEGLVRLANQVIKERNDLRAKNAKLIEAVKKNHEWHLLNDEDDGYSGSELYEFNTTTLVESGEKNI